MDAVRLVVAARVFDLPDYQPAGEECRWYYARTDLRRAEAVPGAYERQVQADRQIEGGLIGRQFGPLASYLEPVESPSSAPSSQPIPPLQGGPAFFLEFDPPMPFFPARLSPDEPAHWRRRVHYYDRRGRLRFKGHADRRVVLEGLEDQIVPAGEFEDCLRIRVEMQFRFEWGPRIDTSEYMWLARNVGEVRRIEHIEGVALIRLIDETTGYLLRGLEAGPSGAGRWRPHAWSRCALWFERGLPWPRIGGAFAELVPSRGED